jgi:hypothetical protein
MHFICCEIDTNRRSWCCAKYFLVLGKLNFRPMKNRITQLAFVIVAFVAFTLLMSYARPASVDAKQYIVIVSEGATPAKAKANFTEQVNQKLAEGWQLQGGVASSPVFAFTQSMVK